ncbi:RidA family protein [Bacillus atrophaeus]|uniref:Endoribonuclease L-PSP n=1 Tax=Bacillus atrophaeus (strain 1942) TaxID=720555 RepID=A0ABN3ZA66_BACA1|nr:RidA family protein [Bacillus atrophaeus]AMR62704.1 enamine deaminase RidA [Bacillus subtilis subsp. globigii]ADP32431.1 endoribonuclease L-PSP [Bacillus atrophaeus 1942]AIK46840.1 endoribonuclease L-PSP family protein [Bacillus atrophaeus subsp. globigii]EIM11770.1 endoribonuclease L-PSP [Bacillus atrophaeus C89]KFK84218.1 endoribonuclease L-PSP family protein [Bacillus atrophaeus]
MKSIFEVGNLKSNGHYALATVHQNTVHVSGQFAINPETCEKKFGTIEEEILQALKNVEMIVEAAGSKKEKILRMTLYIPDVKLWDKVDAVYKEFFGEHKPARTVVPTNELHFGFKIEIDAIAYI